MPEAKRPLKTTLSLLVMSIVVILLLVYSLVTFTDTQPQLPTALPTVTTHPTATALPDEIVDGQGVSMRLVPAGEFNMGTEQGQQQESPVHSVYLDDFYIDKYEVTNVFYQACVAAGACDSPKSLEYYDDPAYQDYPVGYVDWYMASTYCEWREGRLPTEAQWEKAARGTDERLYPWGDEISYQEANYLDNSIPQSCVGRMVKVGSYPKGVSPYGVYELAGNAWEWVADWYEGNIPYEDRYYANSPTSNPQGPETGDRKVLRGGSWWNIPFDLRTTTRNWDNPSVFGAIIGFRCAKDAGPR